VTSRDPLAEWTAGDFPTSHRPADAVHGANARLDALRPLIAAADALMDAANVVLDQLTMTGTVGPDARDELGDCSVRYDLAVRDLTTPKGDTP
jgi:phage-related minor tail protein